jgi:hypothetical protein
LVEEFGRFFEIAGASPPIRQPAQRFGQEGFVFDRGLL